MWFQAEQILRNSDVSYKGPEPPFYEIYDFPFLYRLSSNTEEILNEYNRFKANHQPSPYFNSSQVSARGGWLTVPLLTWSLYRKYHHDFPFTVSLLRQIPEIVSASFSVLQPHSSILEHSGDTDRTVRAHLCLTPTPDHRSLRFTVNGVSNSWKQGEWILFCDAYPHSGVNNSEAERVILLIDMVRQPKDDKHFISAKVLAGLTLNRLLLGIKITNLPARKILLGIYYLLIFLFRILLNSLHIFKGKKSRGQ